MKTLDLRTLESVEEHPRVQEARRTLTDALDQQAQMDARADAADAELAAAEDAAAHGRRDDKRLQRARDAVRECQAEQRIAARRTANAERALSDATHTTCEELHQQLQDEYGPAIKRFDAALAEAQRRSHDVATWEEVSRRLLGGNLYRDLPGRSVLRDVAWWKEFGGPRSTGHSQTSRYSTWRTFCRRWLDG